MKEFYSIHLTESACAELLLLPPDQRSKILNDIEYLSINPYGDRSRRIRETPLYRLRIEEWRAIYAVSENTQTITLYALRKRRDLRA